MWGRSHPWASGGYSHLWPRVDPPGRINPSRPINGPVIDSPRRPAQNPSFPSLLFFLCSSFGINSRLPQCLLLPSFLFSSSSFTISVSSFFPSPFAGRPALVGFRSPISSAVLLLASRGRLLPDSDSSSAVSGLSSSLLFSSPFAGRRSSDLVCFGPAAPAVVVTGHWDCSRSNCTSRGMSSENLLSKVQKPANFRLCKVSSHATEVLEIQADDPALQVLFIPGNPGVIAFYKDFLESLYELLGGRASITGVGHISHTEKNWEGGQLFSMQEQIDHKTDFIKQQLRNTEVPVVLVGHSIGSYLSIELFKRSLGKVIYCIGLYPFLALNLRSKKQSMIEKIAASSILSTALSFTAASLGLLPRRVLWLVVSNTLGKSWSPSAIEATCTHLSQYHVLRNMLFMTMTEFKKLAETPDWAFMRKNQSGIAFLFGIDDHWGPLQTFEEISKQAPGIALSIEDEGHTHAFCTTQAGSVWVARHVAALIKKTFSSLMQ